MDNTNYRVIIQDFLISTFGRIFLRAWVHDVMFLKFKNLGQICTRSFHPDIQILTHVTLVAVGRLLDAAIASS